MRSRGSTRRRYEYGHRLATPECDRGVVDAHCHGITANRSLMQNLDFSALDEPKLEQPALGVV
jgi:hypothetical protein